MKNFPIRDALFIIVGGSLMLWITESGFGGFFSKFPFVVLILGYYAGKLLNHNRLKKGNYN